MTLVPASALFPLPVDDSGAGSPGAMAVFALEQGRARLRTVQLEARNVHTAWVRSGAKAGDAVIAYPPANVRDGARVTARAD